MLLVFFFDNESLEVMVGHGNNNYGSFLCLFFPE